MKPPACGPPLRGARPSRWRRAALAAVLAATPVGAAAQVVAGRVVEHGTGTPIPGASVSLLDRDGATVRGALSNEDGSFLLLAPAPGEYGLAVSAFGYREVRGEGVLVRDSERVVLDLTMTADPIVLGSVEVITRDRSLRQRYLREHWERMEEAEPHEIGRTVFPRAELERYEGFPYSNFMDAMAPRLSARCAPVVFWDGWEREPDGYMSLADIEGVEFHPGTGPVDTHFVNPAGCGVVLVWSRPDAEVRDRGALGFGFAVAVAGAVVLLMSMISGV